MTSLWLSVSRRFNQSMSLETLVWGRPRVVVWFENTLTLSMWTDHELSMKQHVIKVAGACFHQLRHLRQIRRRVGREVTTRLFLALVISRLDYCNSVLAGLSASIAKSPECRRSPHLSTEATWTRHTVASAAALVASETTSAVQTLHDHVRCPPRLSSVTHHWTHD